MIPTPEVIGLAVCERVIIEAGTKNPSLISLFLGMSVHSFPSDPASFSVFAPLTDGLGEGIIEVGVTRLDTNDQVYEMRMPVLFPDRLSVMNLHFRLTRVIFPAAGWYAVTLSVDDELVAQRRIRVYRQEELS